MKLHSISALSRLLRLHYPKLVNSAGWLLGGWEMAFDRFHNPGLFTASFGAIMYRRVRRRNDADGE